VIFHCGIVTTAPERPVGNVARLAHDVTAEVGQFYCGYLATVRDVETAILVIPCAETYRKEIQFDPGI